MKDDYILFVTQFLKHQSQKGQTGGTLSNFFFLKALSTFRKVRVLSFDVDTQQVALFAKEGIEVFASPPPKWKGVRLVMHWNSFVRKEIVCFIREYGMPGHLVVTTSSVPALDGIDGIPKCKCSVVIQAYENFGLRPPKVSWRSRLSLAKLAMIGHFSDARLMRKADNVITNSNFMKRVISHRFGVDMANIRIVPQLCDMPRSKQTYLDVLPNVGFVTRGSEKNLPFILELSRRAPDLTFLVYGHTDGIGEGFPENVRVMGWASDRQIMIESAAVWLMPSTWAEPFGRVSIEAQAADRIALVIDSGGLSETVVDRQFVIPNFDPEVWVQKIREVMELPVSVVENNGQVIRNMFSQAAHDNEIRRIFIS
ncbi:glycosyltransferase family 4 protein [Halomonas sp. MA07-2]|uniref:glycosyltransferase family 4 protein n=1 Tax=Halomonas sp. MA07-2 TaxID=3440841 RepID=UPI003EE900C4